MTAKDVDELVAEGCSRETAEKMHVGDLVHFQGLSQKEAMDQLSMNCIGYGDKVSIIRLVQLRSSNAVDWNQNNNSVVDSAAFSQTGDRKQLKRIVLSRVHGLLLQVYST